MACIDHGGRLRLPLQLHLQTGSGGADRERDSRFTEQVMDAIQALSSKSKPVAATAGAPASDDSVANAFAALLNIVGSTFKGANALGVEAKLLRSDDAASARADDARDAAKVRDEKSDERAAAKPKDSKSRDDKQQESDTDTAKASTDDKTSSGAAAGQPSQTAQDQAAAQIAATVAFDVPVVTSEVLAPVLIAQQVAAPVEATATTQTAVEAVAVVSEPAAVDANAAKVAAAAAATPETAKVEVPAAITKTAENNGPILKQVAAEAAAPVQSAVAQETAKAATVVSENTGAAKTSENAQANALTQRSAAAQAQSQDLSRQVGPDIKAQVQVTVNGPAHAQTTATSVYDIYSGYNNTQTSTANGQAGAAETTNALVQNPKTPVEATQAQAAASPSPAVAPQTQAPQQGASSSAVRAEIAAPAPTQTGGSQNNGGSHSAAFSNTGAQNSSAAAATTQAAPTERPLATAQQVIDQIKVNITRAAKAGLDKLTIRLKPIELGRVDVQLEMSEDHKVRVTVTADNKDTLALLQGDSRTLERALNDAGLRTDSNNLHFSLRSESDAQNAGDGKGNGKNANDNDNGATDDADDIAMTYDYAEAARVRGGVDTFA